MRKITFGEPVLKVEGLSVKFDVVPVSNSLAILIGDKDLASIVQQLYYWTFKGYGEVIDGVRWFYKPIKEWIEEVFPTFSNYQMGKLMTQLAERGIIRREKLFTKHQILKGDRFWWQPKNQTYYYSLNTEKLQELADNYKTAETPENPVFIKTQILSDQEIKNTKDFDCSKNITKNTSIENKSRDRSHPTLPCEGDREKLDSQRTQVFSNSELLEINETSFADPKVIEKEISSERVEENINQNINTNVQEAVQVEFVKPKPKFKTPTDSSFNSLKLATDCRLETKQNRKDQAPWKDEDQLKEFYHALIRALPIVANSYSPQGLAKTIIAQLKRGEEHTYWDDFKAGLAIGTSTKPEWEIEPGVPYPMFVEYLTEKIKRGDNTQPNEQARNEAFRILRSPQQTMSFWGVFKRSVVNVSEQIERDRDLGVSNPSTPVWTKERVEPSIEEAERAGDKIMAVNGTAQAVIIAAKTPKQESLSESVISDPWTDEEKPKVSMREMLAQMGVKGFCKPMPKVSEEKLAKEKREQRKPKTNIATMAIAEINDYLTDPILRAQLMPQLWDSDYELITDYLGQIIGVKAPPAAEE